MGIEGNNLVIGADDAVLQYYSTNRADRSHEVNLGVTGVVHAFKFNGSSWVRDRVLMPDRGNLPERTSFLFTPSNWNQAELFIRGRWVAFGIGQTNISEGNDNRIRLSPRTYALVVDNSGGDSGWAFRVNNDFQNTIITTLPSARNDDINRIIVGTLPSGVSVSGEVFHEEDGFITYGAGHSDLREPLGTGIFDIFPANTQIRIPARTLITVFNNRGGGQTFTSGSSGRTADIATRYLDLFTGLNWLTQQSLHKFPGIALGSEALAGVFDQIDAVRIFVGIDLEVPP